jgi:hypothetical protein
MHSLCPARGAGDLIVSLGLALIVVIAILAGVEFREAAGAALRHVAQHDPAPAMLLLAVSGMVAVNAWFAWHIRSVYTAVRHGGYDA